MIIACPSNLRVVFVATLSDHLGGVKPKWAVWEIPTRGTSRGPSWNEQKDYRRCVVAFWAAVSRAMDLF